MLSNSYLDSAKPISLHSLLDASNYKGAGPSIDLQWDPFQSTVELFLKAVSYLFQHTLGSAHILQVDGYVSEAKTEIATRAKSHADSVKILKSNKEEMERRIQTERERERGMLSELENERQIVSNLNTSISHLQRSLAKVREQSATVENDLVAMRREVQSKETEQERHRVTLEDMSARDEVELKWLEMALGLRINGVREGVLLMRFTLLDPAEPDREFAFLLDVSGSNYAVPNCSPSLSALPELVRQLNTDRNMLEFIKKVRKAFRATVPDRPAPGSQFDGLPGPGMRTPGHKRGLSQNEFMAA